MPSRPPGITADVLRQVSTLPHRESDGVFLLIFSRPGLLLWSRALPARMRLSYHSFFLGAMVHFHSFWGRFLVNIPILYCVFCEFPGNLRESACGRILSTGGKYQSIIKPLPETTRVLPKKTVMAFSRYKASWTWAVS